MKIKIEKIKYNNYKIEEGDILIVPKNKKQGVILSGLNGLDYTAFINSYSFVNYQNIKKTYHTITLCNNSNLVVTHKNKVLNSKKRNHSKIIPTLKINIIKDENINNLTEVLIQRDKDYDEYCLNQEEEISIREDYGLYYIEFYDFDFFINILKTQAVKINDYFEEIEGVENEL